MTIRLRNRSSVVGRGQRPAFLGREDGADQGTAIRIKTGADELPVERRQTCFDRGHGGARALRVPVVPVSGAVVMVDLVRCRLPRHGCAVIDAVNRGRADTPALALELGVERPVIAAGSAPPTLRWARRPAQPRACRLATPPLPLEQRALALDAPAIAGERAVGAHHAMAWDRDRDRVRRARLGDRAHGLRPADALGDLGIARGRPARNARSACQTRLLERRAAHVERQIEPMRRRLDEAHDLRDQSLELLIAADQKRLRETVLKVADKGVRVVAELDRADPFPGRRDENRAERAFADREANRRAIAAGTKCARRHAKEIGRSGIETPAGIETGTVDRLGDRGTLFQLVPHAPRAPGVGVGFGRHPGDRLEHPVEVKAAHAGGPGERVEARRLFGLLDQATGMRHHRRVAFGQRLLVRPAALARAKARRLRLLAGGVEGDVRAARQARGAARPAVHAGGQDRIVKHSDRGAVTASDRIPPRIAGGEGWHGLLLMRSGRHGSHRGAPRASIGRVAVSSADKCGERRPASTPVLALESREGVAIVIACRLLSCRR